MSASEPIVLSTTGTADESVPDLIARLKAEHAFADGICKHVQGFRRSAGIPAINELRYSGYHATIALPSAEGGDFDRHQLVKAISHAQRASYEAAEAGILTCLDQIALFKRDYELIPITDVLPSWIEILDLAFQAQDRLQLPRQTGDVRSYDHVHHRELFDKLLDCCRKLDCARDELNKKMRAARVTTSRWYAMAILTLAGLAIAGIGLLVHLS